MFKKFLILCVLALGYSCSSDNGDIDPGIPEIPIPNPQDTTSVSSVPKAMWITAYNVNFKNLKDHRAVKIYLQRCKELGINMVYVDGMISTGRSLCHVPSMKYSDAETKWEWFESIISTCDTLGLDCVVNMSPLSVGEPKDRKGVVYEENTWEGKTQCKKVILQDENKNYIGYEIVDSKDDKNTDIAALDPSLQEVRDYVAKICSEVVAEYKNHKSFKGLSLDFVRYANAGANSAFYGFGPCTKSFEREMGVSVNEEDDFISTGGGYGKYFADWIYFRSNNVAKTVKQVRDAVKAVSPDCELHLWAGADWVGRYIVGQNWATNSTSSYVPNNSRIYKEGYEKTGFAEYLDVFILGSYAEAVWRNQNPDPLSIWSVENFVMTYNTYIPKNHKCKVYGSLAAYAYNQPNDKYQKMYDATMLCLSYTDGVMIFELGHVTNNNLWEAIGDAIKKTNGNK